MKKKVMLKKPKAASEDKRKVKERQILFSGEMVRAILAGRKTQTRRVVKVPLDYGDAGIDIQWAVDNISCPYGQPGDRLWVRETFYRWKSTNFKGYEKDDVVYMDDLNLKGMLHDKFRLTVTANDKVGNLVIVPAIHMPRWASRITLEIISVRVERLQTISERDCEAELGVEPYSLGDKVYAKFMELWNSINAARGFSWRENPWVWVIEFKRMEANPLEIE